eukprot:g1562.t1 g1562   contig10:2340695-2341170(-)
MQCLSHIRLSTTQRVSATDQKEQTIVRFRDVFIREYEVVTSDNPSVPEGAGLELGWNYNILLDHTPIDEFEKTRLRKRRNSMRQTMHLHIYNDTLDFESLGSLIWKSKKHHVVLQCYERRGIGPYRE